MEELQRFNKVAVGRETRMIEQACMEPARPRADTQDVATPKTGGPRAGRLQTLLAFGRVMT